MVLTRISRCCVASVGLHQPVRRLFIGAGDVFADTIKNMTSKEYSERRQVGYSSRQMFDLVSDVEHYKEFVPWCSGSQVISRDENHLKAILTVGFKAVSESYSSLVTMKRPQFVKARSEDSLLFNHLSTTWRFSPTDNGGCHVDFHISFEFRSVLHAQVSSLFFNEVVKTMVNAFEERCLKVYGPPSCIA